MDIIKLSDLRCRAMLFDVESIKDVRGAKMDVTGSLEVDPVDLKRSVVEFINPVNFKGSVTNAGDCMLVKGVIDSRVKAVCDMCLSEFEYSLHLPFEQSYSTTDTRASSLMFDLKDEDDLAQLDEIGIYCDNEIDVSTDVVQSLILSIPIRIECKEDCKGLCVNCGVNLNDAKCKCEK